MKIKRILTLFGLLSFSYVFSPTNTNTTSISSFSVSESSSDSEDPSSQKDINKTNKNNSSKIIIGVIVGAAFVGLLSYIYFKNK